jgi:hypothetical protein
MGLSKSTWRGEQNLWDHWVFFAVVLFFLKKNPPWRMDGLRHQGKQLLKASFVSSPLVEYSTYLVHYTQTATKLTFHRVVPDIGIHAGKQASSVSD